MGLRIQLERQKKGLFPSVKEYNDFYGLTPKRIKLADPEVLIMHPGPMNRGVEISSQVADSTASAIDEQVTNGVAVRKMCIRDSPLPRTAPLCAGNASGMPLGNRENASDPRAYGAYRPSGDWRCDLWLQKAALRPGRTAAACQRAALYPSRYGGVPVSYTHPDVYKRQMHSLPRSRQWCAAEM